jgi:RNA processing factor Prp31
MVSAAILMLTFTSTNYSNAQNATANDSYAAGSLMDSANQTTSELGQNASTVLNKAGEEVGSTLNQLGQNMSDVGSEIGSEILNETKETAKKVGIGAADVLSNISGEIKEGITGK